MMLERIKHWKNDAFENNLASILSIPGTPQFNGWADQKFAMLYGHVRTMLNAARLPKDLREGVWAEAA
jgi:hypothetical protein